MNKVSLTAKWRPFMKIIIQQKKFLKVVGNFFFFENTSKVGGIKNR